MTILLSILDFLMLPWVFIILNGLIVLWCNSLTKDKDFPVGPLFLIGLLIGGYAYRFELFRAFIISWQGVAWCGGGYVLIGGVVALWKWVIVLVDFRPRAREWLKRPLDVRTDPPYADRMSRSIYSTEDKVLESEGRYYPNWRKFPLATWWVYWPFFILSVVIDPINRSVKQMLKWAGGLLERLSKKFSVS